MQQRPIHVVNNLFTPPSDSTDSVKKQAQTESADAAFKLLIFKGNIPNSVEWM